MRVTNGHFCTRLLDIDIIITNDNTTCFHYSRPFSSKIVIRVNRHTITLPYGRLE